MIRLFFAAAVSLALCSCQTFPINTPSGRPEVTAKSSMSRAKTTAMKLFVGSGWSMTSQSENALTFEKPMTPDKAALFLLAVGNASYSQPVVITRLTFLPVGNEVKIYGAIHASAQGPFGQVQNMDFTDGKDGQRLQQSLVVIRNQANGR